MRKPRMTTDAQVVATVLGCDPGFASFGWALVDLMSDSSLALIGVGVIRTAKDAAKREVFAASDNFNRAKLIGGTLHRLVETNNVRALCAESMSFPRSSSVAAKMAMSWGLLAMIAEQRHMPLVALSPQKIKQSVAGTKTASKIEIQTELEHSFPTLAGMLLKLPKGKHEHACDALASIVAGSNSDVINALWRR